MNVSRSSQRSAYYFDLSKQPGVCNRSSITKPPKTYACKQDIQMGRQHAKPSLRLHLFVLDLIADLLRRHACGCHVLKAALPNLQAETLRSDT